MMNGLNQSLVELCWIAHETEDEKLKCELMRICEMMYNELKLIELSQTIEKPSQIIITEN